MGVGVGGWVDGGGGGGGGGVCVCTLSALCMALLNPVA